MERIKERVRERVRVWISKRQGVDLRVRLRVIEREREGRVRILVR